MVILNTYNIQHVLFMYWRITALPLLANYIWNFLSHQTNWNSLSLHLVIYKGVWTWSSKRKSKPPYLNIRTEVKASSPTGESTPHDLHGNLKLIIYKRICISPSINDSLHLTINSSVCTSPSCIPEMYQKWERTFTYI